MSEEMTNLAPESVVPAEVTNNVPPIDETGTVPELDADGNPIQPTEETEEVEWQDGKKYVIPKALKGALMKDADYTQKTQQIAEQRRAIEAQAQQVRQQAEFQQQNRKEFAQLESMTDQIAQFEKIDWASAMQADPVSAQAAYMQFQQLKDSRAALQQSIGQREQRSAFEQQQATVRQLEHAQQVLQREIADWSPEKATQLNKFAQETFGFTPAEMGQVTDARLVKLLNLAHIGQQMMAKAKQSAPSAAVTPKPASSVSGRAPAAAKSEDKMSDAEWAEHRRKQREKK